MHIAYCVLRIAYCLLPIATGAAKTWGGRNLNVITESGINKLCTIPPKRQKQVMNSTYNKIDIGGGFDYIYDYDSILVYLRPKRAPYRLWIVRLNSTARQK